MTDHEDFELQLAQLQSEFRVFRDNHFYHFQRGVDSRFDKLEDMIKEKKLWLAMAATFVVVAIDFLSHI